jgi:hypothetical protein
MVTTDATGELPDSRTESDGSAVVRVLGYNIRSMRDDEDALARVIRACAPDVVLVQEAPRFFRWRTLPGSPPGAASSSSAAAPPPRDRCCSARCGPPSNGPRTCCCR